MSASTSTTTMRALVHHRYGDAGALSVGTTAVPTPAAGEVLIRVRAASVNPADVFIMSGSPAILRLSFGLTRPKQPIRGWDVAGVVEAVGASVTRWAVGDAVFGEGTGTFAEYAIAHEDKLAALPNGVPFEHGAAAPMAGITAQMGLEILALAPGDRLIINGASGGIGQFAVQLAHNAGLHVTGVCSTRNVERVRSLGADVVLDYTVDDVLSPPEPYAGVFDNVGSVRMRDWERITLRGGVILPNSGIDGPDGGAIRRVIKSYAKDVFSAHRIKRIPAVVTAARLEQFAADMASGAVTPLIDTMFPLEHAADAVARVASNHARGKVIITMPA